MPHACSWYGPSDFYHCVTEAEAAGGSLPGSTKRWQSCCSVDWGQAVIAELAALEAAAPHAAPSAQRRTRAESQPRPALLKNHLQARRCGMHYVRVAARNVVRSGKPWPSSLQTACNITWQLLAYNLAYKNAGTGTAQAYRQQLLGLLGCADSRLLGYIASDVPLQMTPPQKILVESLQQAMHTDKYALNTRDAHARVPDLSCLLCSIDYRLHTPMQQRELRGRFML